MSTFKTLLGVNPSWISKVVLLSLMLLLAACKPGGNNSGHGGGGEEENCEKEHKGKGHEKNSGNPGHDKDGDGDDDHKGKKKCSGGTSTSTTTSTSTNTSTEIFPEIPNRVCTVDSFQQNGEEQQIKKVDILFVMDHSGSMRDDWERVANNVKSLVRELPEDSDVRYGVLLADVGTWRGKLYAPAGWHTVLDNQKMSDQEISTNLHKIFTEGMKVSDAGSGESSFHSLFHAVTTNAVANQKLGFFRADAALSVIFMSDEQEIGYPFPSPQAPGLPPRCDSAFEDGIKRDYYDKKGINLDVAFNAVKKLKGDLPVKTHAFINITKEDLFTRNSKNSQCLYDSLGYGYMEMVEKTKGVLFSIQANKAEGLARCGKVIKESLGIQHEFTLSKTADKVDPTTVMAAVDGVLVSHEYRAPSNSVYLENAGKALSRIAVRHCEPDGRVVWNLTGFNGTPARFSVGLGWTTAEFATNGKINYGTSADNLSGTVSSGAKSTNHAVTVSDLSPNTVYYFQAVSSDEFGVEKKSNVLSFRTLPDWTLSGFAGQAARTSASVQWSTFEYATKGRVHYGVNAENLDQQTEETAVSTSHTVEIGGLTPDTLYFFQCAGKDEFGLEKRSSVIAIRTEADWGITGFTGQASRTTVNLQWNTPDQVADGKVLFGTSEHDLSQSAIAAGTGLSHAVSVGGLSPGTNYYFQAVSQDGQGVEKRSAVILVHTAEDWEIAGFTGQSTQNEVSLSWNTPGYSTNGRVFFGSSDSNLNNVVADLNLGASHSVTVSGLNPDTLYYFQASSTDSDGIEKRGGVVAIRTQKIPLPDWMITSFVGSSTKNSATLTWNTDQYATTGKILWGESLATVGTEVDGAGAGTSHSVTVNGLEPNTLYYFVAVSADDRGQEKSSDVIAIRTMQDDVVIPPANWSIIGFDGTSTTTQVNLIWQTPGAQTTAVVKVGLSATDLTHAEVNIGNAAETHVIGVGQLTPNTQYFFQVIATDSAGKTVESVIIGKKTKTP